MTRRAMEFMTEAGDRPWCLHLSYIKPHWPYIAPAPYNDMYGPDDVIPAVKSEAERADPHPVYREFMNHLVARNFSRDEVRREVIPVYMGLIKQIDDQLGRAVRVHARTRLARQHADRVHLRSWRLSRRSLARREGSVPRAVGEDSADRVRSVAAADATRGSVCDAPVESIDLLPTFLDALGSDPVDAIAPARRPLAAAVAARRDTGRRGARSRSANTTIRCCRQR